MGSTTSTKSRCASTARSIKRFKVGGKYKGADAGILIAIPEDDVEGQKLHAYHLDADNDFNFRLPIKAGARTISASFTDRAPGVDEMVPLRARSIKSSNFDDASAPSIGTIEVSGPHNAVAPQDTVSRRQIFVCRPAAAREDDACARRIISTLARRAYRRPVTDADTRELMKLYTIGRQDGNFDAGIGRALEGLLSMPAFLFRLEQDPANAKPGQTYRVSDLELASRLSFFLWKSIPDDELLDVAARGRLKEPAVLSQQVRRMLADGKATRWMNDFVGQWLQVRNLQAMEPDPNIFPGFDDNLREAMIKETALFFESQVRDDRPVQDLLQSNYTFLNQQLARHYGVDNVYGSHFRRVQTDRSGAAGTAWTGERLDRFVIRAPDLGRAARQVGAREPARHAATGAAAQRAAARRERREERAQVAARPHGTAPRQPGLRVVPQPHGSAGICARELRCHRQMARQGGRRRHRPVQHPRRRDEDCQPADLPRAAPQPEESVHRHRHGKAARVRDGPLGRILRSADAFAQLVRETAGVDHKWSALILGIVNSQPFQMRRVLEQKEPAAAGTTVAQAR